MTSEQRKRATELRVRAVLTWLLGIGIVTVMFALRWPPLPAIGGLGAWGHGVLVILLSGTIIGAGLNILGVVADLLYDGLRAWHRHTQRRGKQD